MTNIHKNKVIVNELHAFKNKQSIKQDIDKKPNKPRTPELPGTPYSYKSQKM